MISFREIYETYQKTQQCLWQDDERLSFTSRDLRLTLNSLAYFLLAFSAMESHIDEQIEQVHGGAHNFEFRAKVNEIFGRGSIYAQVIDEYYSIRCEVAHGRFTSTRPVDVGKVISLFSKIAAEET